MIVLIFLFNLILLLYCLCDDNVSVVVLFTATTSMGQFHQNWETALNCRECMYLLWLFSQVLYRAFCFSIYLGKLSAFVLAGVGIWIMPFSKVTLLTLIFCMFIFKLLDSYMCTIYCTFIVYGCLCWISFHDFMLSFLHIWSAFCPDSCAYSSIDVTLALHKNKLSLNPILFTELQSQYMENWEWSMAPWGASKLSCRYSLVL